MEQKGCGGGVVFGLLQRRGDAVSSQSGVEAGREQVHRTV